MSALRKQEPFPTTDAASQKRASAGSAPRDVINEAEIDAAERRPPQSVAAAVTEDETDTSVDDTYDGEIVSSTVDPAPQPGGPQAGQAQSSYASSSHASSAQADSRQNDAHLFDQRELRDFRARWDQVQTTFVDDPRHAVEQADALVGAVVKRIADQFSAERARLESQRSRGQNVSTEDLRQNFQRYRAFFDRLLAF